MAFTRLSQQILVVAYNTATALRVSALAVEVLRTTGGTTFVPPKKKTTFTTAVR